MISSGSGIEVLSRPEAFRKAWPKLIRSYALDAIDMRMEKGAGGSTSEQAGGGKTEEISPETITRRLASINPQDASTNKFPGLGEDIRWMKEAPWGSCWFMRGM